MIAMFKHDDFQVGVFLELFILDQKRSPEIIAPLLKASTRHSFAGCHTGRQASAP